jgi:Ca2+-binding RTX toxin-like protein
MCLWDWVGWTGFWAREATTVSAVGNDDLELSGGEGKDRIRSGPGNDRLAKGGPGNDIVVGSVGDDRVDGNLGDDTLLGGDGFVRLLGGPGRDIGDGGPGIDTQCQTETRLNCGFKVEVYIATGNGDRRVDSHRQGLSASLPS